MNGRGFNLNKYPFGFNGQEKDREIYNNESTTTATFWEYDGRIGRRWNVDPKPDASMSNYACFANNPILFSDPLGDTLRVACQNQGIFMEDLCKQFGDEASILFEFDENENLQFSEIGQKMLYMRSSLKENKGDVMQGINKIITSEELTEVIYESNSNAEIKNPETGDYYKANGSDIKVRLNSLGGGATVTIWDAKNRFKDKNIKQNSVFLDTKETSNNYGDKRYNTLFHEFGHVLNQKNSQQESVIEYDNKARQESGDKKRSIDNAHKNTADPK